jgi:putative two-component system response regulator
MVKKKETILVVDDNNINLVACKKILKPFYEVYPVPSATKMFKLMEHVRPDLILLDIEMPDINGYEAARTLKANDVFREIPIIFLTARDDPVSEKLGMNIGATDYIHKPFGSEQLLERIRELFKNSPCEQGLDAPQNI